MKTTVETIINYRMCNYTFQGENLANLRRSQLQPIAAAVGIKGELSKNEILTQLLPKLAALDCEKEISDTETGALKVG